MANLHSVDWIMIVTFILTIAIIVITTSLSQTPYKPVHPEQEKDVLTAIKLRNNWLSSSIVFLAIYYWCVLYSILSTIIVLYLSCFEDSPNEHIVRIIIYSAISLFTNILPYVINLKKISKSYRKAYLHIIEAIFGKKPLGTAIQEGEALISDGFDE